MEQGPAVLAARQRNEDPVVVRDHAEIPDGAARKPPDVMLPVRQAVHGLNPKSRGLISQLKKVNVPSTKKRLSEPQMNTDKTINQ